MLVQTQDEKLSDNSMHEAQFNGYSKQMWTKQFWCCVTSDHKITVHACTLVYIYTRTYPPVDGVDNTQVWKGQGGTSENKVQRAGRQECLGSFKHNLNNKTHNNCWCYNNRMSVFKSSNKRHPQLLVFFYKKNALQIVHGPTRHYTQFAPLTKVGEMCLTNISYSGHQAYGCWSIAT